MKKLEFVRYHDFLYEKFTQYRNAVNVTPVTFNEFKKGHNQGHSLQQWLSSLSGLTLTENQLDAVTRTYMHEANKSFSDIPSIHFLLKTRYSMTLPLRTRVTMKSHF